MVDLFYKDSDILSVKIRVFFRELGSEPDLTEEIMLCFRGTVQ